MQKQIFLEVSFQGSANDSLIAADSIALRQSHGGAIGNETTITLVLVMVTTDITLTVVVIVVMMNVPEAHRSSQRLYKAYDTLYEVKAALLRFPHQQQQQ